MRFRRADRYRLLLRIIDFGSKLSGTRFSTLVVGIATLSLMLLTKQYAPRVVPIENPKLGRIDDEARRG
jgi:hypothetical protein